jgi:hypothetical protein
MLVVCCTTKLLKRLRVETAPPSATPEPRLGEWYATILQMRPQHLVLLVNEPTRLAAVLPARDFGVLGQRISDAIVRVLQDLGLDAGAIDHERRAMADVTFAKTASRSVRGTMSEFGFQLEQLRNAHPHMPEHALAMHLGRAPVEMPRYGCRAPADVARQLLAGE